MLLSLDSNNVTIHDGDALSITATATGCNPGAMVSLTLFLDEDGPCRFVDAGPQSVTYCTHMQADGPTVIFNVAPVVSRGGSSAVFTEVTVRANDGNHADERLLSLTVK